MHAEGDRPLESASGQGAVSWRGYLGLSEGWRARGSGCPSGQLSSPESAYWKRMVEGPKKEIKATEGPKGRLLEIPPISPSPGFSVSFIINSAHRMLRFKKRKIITAPKKPKHEPSMDGLYHLFTRNVQKRQINNCLRWKNGSGE